MKKIKITQIRSATGAHKKQKRTIQALGLGKLHRQRELSDTPVIRGMVNRVAHLLKVETVDDSE